MSILSTTSFKENKYNLKKIFNLKDKKTEKKFNSIEKNSDNLSINKKLSDIYGKYDICRTISLLGLFSSGLLANIFFWKFQPLNLLDKILNISTSIIFVRTIREIILSLINELTVLKLSNDQNKEKALLFCRSSHDWNGALGIRKNVLESLKEYSKTHSIVYVKMNDVNDINNVIDYLHESNRKITDIWLNCHGNINTCLIGKNTLIGNKKHYFNKVKKSKNNALFSINFGFLSPKIKKENYKTVDKIHFDKLDPNVNIILHSCSTGKKGSDNQINIAQWFQYYAGKTRKVFAPRSLITSNSINFTNIGKDNLNVIFKDLFWRDRTAQISYDEVANKVKQFENDTKKA